MQKEPVVLMGSFCINGGVLKKINWSVVRTNKRIIIQKRRLSDMS